MAVGKGSIQRVNAAAKAAAEQEEKEMPVKVTAEKVASKRGRRPKTEEPKKSVIVTDPQIISHIQCDLPIYLL